ncbi:MAG TPA: hypothetical protein VFM87_10765 [Agrococcus sp.]|nr:hypothetical protein [Agrococcus sp.]
MSTYEITVYRDGRWWMVAIPEIDGLTQARKLREAPRMAMEYIALATDQDASEFEVAITQLRVDDIDVTQHLAQIRDERARADALYRSAAARAAALAKDLSAASVSVREIGAAMNISFQRASQLVNS